MTQPVQDSASHVQQAVREGSVGTLIRIFFTPGMLDAVNQGPEALDQYSANFERSGHWSVGSWASAYIDGEAAALAMEVVLEEFGTTWQLQELDDPGLGDEGAMFEGNPPQAGGVPTTIYFWRSDRYLLQVVAHGSVEADADEIRTIAEGKQSRVPVP